MKVLRDAFYNFCYFILWVIMTAMMTGVAVGTATMIFEFKMSLELIAICGGISLLLSTLVIWDCKRHRYYVVVEDDDDYEDEEE